MLWSVCSRSLTSVSEWEDDYYCSHLAEKLVNIRTLVDPQPDHTCCFDCCADDLAKRILAILDR